MENINFRKKMHGITENKKPGGLESLHLLFFLQEEQNTRQKNGGDNAKSRRNKVQNIRENHYKRISVRERRSRKNDGENKKLKKERKEIDKKKVKKNY